MATLHSAHHLVEEKKDDSDNDNDNVIASSSSTIKSHTTTTNSTISSRSKRSHRPLLLLLCATGITSCYLWYGTVQEHLFQIDNAKNKVGDGDDEQKSITLFLLATGTFSSFLLALIWIAIGPLLLAQKTTNPNNSSKESHNDDNGGRLNHPLLALTSVTYLSAMAASNESLHYVSYPTCVLAKSSN